jgi:RNA polymerase sigma-70 factor, ECF subfamily
MKYSQLSDEKLLRLMDQAQTQALSELYDRYGRLVFSLAWHILGELSASEEVTQDTFLRAWENASSYRPERGKVSTWLARIARNRAIDRLRQQQARRENGLVSLEDIPFFALSDGYHVEGEVALRQEQQRVRWALGQLPREQSEALALAFFGGFTQEEIARALGQPLGTIKTRLRLGMQKLRRLLSEEGPVEGSQAS